MHFDHLHRPREPRSSSHSAELPEQIVPVVLDPVLDPLVALEPADDDDGPGRRAPRRRDAFPFASMRRAPGPAPLLKCCWSAIARGAPVIPAKAGIQRARVCAPNKSFFRYSRFNFLPRVPRGTGPRPSG
jgi:hypothetical protein